ncbi:kinesin-like protein KIN-7K, chloroplastic [Gossypium arboreum]|uniref:kinesin-like protein KIN-7K, chloroplastic n=1 Tax=Gossypium arboreum TaxID=29729 RepID=UPI00081935A3|nr:kinesin-like protein KIN-7K, chloroplastic [Gossypium arboreum]
MESGSSNLSILAPPVFDGENYQACAVRMQAYMEGCDYWEAIEGDYEVTLLPNNPTVNQIKMHKERTTRKAKNYGFGSVKEIWDYLKAEYQGDERIKSIKVLNLIRELERLQMKESESIKEYSDKLIDIANKVRVLGADLSDSRLVQKILVSVPEKYEATIASFENTKDLTQLRVVELIIALQAQEQRRLMRQEGSIERSIEGALKAKMQQGEKGEEQKRNGKNSDCNSGSGSETAVKESSSFQVLEKARCKVQKMIGNGEYLEVKGRGTVAIESCAGTKLILDVLFVPEIDQNLLSVGQLVEKRFKVMFEEGMCLILDSSGNELFRIKMQKKRFSLNPFEEEQMVTLLEQQLTFLSNKLSSFAHEISEEHAEEPRKKNLSQEIKSNVQLLEENSGLCFQNQKPTEKASYAKELTSVDVVEFKNLVGKMELHARKQLEATLEATLVEKEFIEGEY